MKVICDGLELSEAVMKVSKALPAKSLAPYLEGMKLVASNDTLTISATDTDLTIQNVINADVLDEGEVLVPGRFFSDYVKKLTNEQIQLTLSDKQLLIKYTDSEGVIQCLDSTDYPIISRIDQGQKFLIEEDDLKDVINKVIFSVSTDDSRAILKGTLFEVDQYTLTAVALDGYRLALCRKPLATKAEQSIKAIVPARSLNEISKLLEDGSFIATVYIEKSYMLIDLGKTIVTTRLLSGDFINYKQIIPSEFKTIMKINKSLFENALDRASIMSRGDKNNLVKFDIKEGLLTIMSNSDIGNIKENITISIEGKDLVIAFNARYLADCLKVTENEQIKISFSDSVTPCIITPYETDEYLYLILPVRMAN